MAAQEYGQIYVHLERKGTPIGSMDMLIAAPDLTLSRLDICIFIIRYCFEFRYSDLIFARILQLTD